MRTDTNKIKLLNFLKTRHDWVTSKELSLELDVSARSVKYLVSEINKDSLMIESSHNGYRLLPDVVFPDDREDSIPNNYDERKKYIIKTIILEKRNITVFDLANNLCISETTLQNELSRLRTELKKYKLGIHIKSNIVYITGLDKDRQRVLLDMINDEIRSSYFSLENIQNIFTTVDLKVIQNIITDILNEYSYFLDDYSLLNFVLHISLTIELRGSKELLPEIKDNATTANAVKLFEELASPHILRMVNDLYTKLKKTYNMNYGIADIYQASVLMITRVMSNKVTSIDYAQIGDVLGKDINELLDKIVTTVYDNYSINLKNEGFLVRFAFHLKNLLVRLKNNVSITNLQFDNIKEEYPLIYAVSVYISKIIQNSTGYTMPENEISYIALHIGILMEENDAVHNKIKSIIVAPNYNKLGIKISKKLSSVFYESMLISDVVTTLPSKNVLNNIDLIISTYSVSSYGIPNYVVDHLVSEKNIKDLFEIIDEITDQKIKNNFKQKILYFFKEDLFFYDHNYNDSKDAIEDICDVLSKHHYVEDGFKESIYEHEEIAPSSYGKLAISHPLNIDAKKSFIAVSLNPKAISWGMNKVNIVFMLSLRSDDRELFADIFQYITHIFKNDEDIQKVLNINNFNDFVNYLVSMY